MRQTPLTTTSRRNVSSNSIKSIQCQYFMVNQHSEKISHLKVTRVSTLSAKSTVQNCTVLWKVKKAIHFLVKCKGSPYSITERRIPEPIPVLGSQPEYDVNHKPGGRLLLLSARPTVTLTTLKRAATSFAAWWTEAWWVWTVCPILLPDSVATAI